MSTSVVTAGVLAGLLTVTIGVTSAGGALAARTALHGAADASALAAADVLFGLASGEPCDRAAKLATQNGAQLSTCEVRQTTVTVRVERAILGLRVHASARAGLAD